ncbi:M24 family metallopeptidase [Laceyella putida]|uniref:M24 family metallopeptidase n=1 Tax=Laceyella putida TaxID=110101 RepID=A0ABW2RI32_9BACL
MERKWENISLWLKQEGMDMAFVHSTPSVFYLTRFLCHPHERLMGVFLFPEADPFLVCPNMEQARARKAGWTGQLIGYDDAQDPWVMIGEALRKRGIGRDATIAIEKESLSYARVEALTQLVPGATFTSVDARINQLRLVKSADELNILREAALIADEAVQVGLDALAIGCTEMEIVAQIELAMKKRGIREMSFPTTVLFGDNSALPHGTPGGRPLQKGDFVLFDLGVVLDGYCSDITRTFAYQEASEEQRAIYDAVLTAQVAAVEACRPGLRMGDLDLIARNLIKERGYGEYFTHRLGHGLGIDVHEYPSIHERNDDPLQTGMVFTIEPGVYVPGVGGVRIEDDVVITADGAEVLTRFPKEFQIIH